LKILITTIGSHGDVHPFLGIGAALRQRGHDVTIIASELYRPLALKLNLDFASIGTAEEFQAGLRNPDLWNPIKGARRIGILIEPLVARVYDAIANLAEKGDTILVYSSLGFGARIAQEKLDLPGVSIHLSPAVFRSFVSPPKLFTVRMPLSLPIWTRRMMFNVADRLYVDPIFAPPINNLRKSLGLPPVRSVLVNACTSPLRNVGLFPAWFAAPQPDWPRNSVLTGFPLFDESGQTPMPPEIEKFLDAGPPPLAFTPGSGNMYGQAFFAAAVGACQILKRRGILLSRHSENIPRDLPDSILCAPYAPFSQLLPCCAALIHHGGIGTTAQGLAAGVPQLVMPMGYDQFDNADRLSKLNVGALLPPAKFTAQTVAIALDRLLSSTTIAAACRSAAERVRADGDVSAKTARLIEKV
jgi:rhamnosyltransferase subunit B